MVRAQVDRQLRAIRVAILTGALTVVPGVATAGPPFLTDDPEPVDYQHFEFYTFSMGTHVSGDTSGFGPAWEFNYGLIPNGQFHIIAPMAFDSPAGGPSQFGFGDTELGFKYRFIQEDDKGLRPMVGVFPFLELPTGDEGNGLGAGHARMYFPVWVQKSFGDWTTYGGGGYWVNHGGGTDDQNYWFFGWLLQKQVTKKLAVGGEIFHQTADTIGGKDSTGFNIGAIYDFDDHNHLLVASADLVALCQFLPGPASSQVGFSIGLIRGGYLGGLAAWVAFTLPSAILLVLFAYGANALKGPIGAGLLHGLKLVAVAIVAQAVWGMARTLCPDRERASIAVVTALIILFSTCPYRKSNSNVLMV